MRYSIFTAMALIVAAAAGCAHRLDLPVNFVEAPDRGPYHFRGIAADGTVLAVRTEQNPRNGTLDFWSEAITGQLADGQGYRLLESEAVTSASGSPGKLMTFAADRRGTEFRYLVALFIRQREVLIAEAGGKAKPVEERLGDLKKSLLSAR